MARERNTEVCGYHRRQEDASKNKIALSDSVAWVLAAGFPNPRNRRVQGIEAKLRKYAGRLPKKQTKAKLLRWNTRTNYAKAFLQQYALLHSQKSPSCTTL